MVTSWMDANWFSTGLGYDLPSRMLTTTDRTGKLMTITYDTAGRLASIKDAKGNLKPISASSGNRSLYVNAFARSPPIGHLQKWKKVIARQQTESKNKSELPFASKFEFCIFLSAVI